jgi:hypothetical protein
VLLDSKDYTGFSNYAAMYTSLLNDESKVGFQNMQNQTNLNATGKEDLQIAKLKRMQVKFSKIYR